MHNAARSLSSPSFQLSTNVGNEYTSSQWSKFVDAKLSNSPYSTKFVDCRSWIINRLLDVLVCSIAIYIYSLFAQLELAKTCSDNTGTKRYIYCTRIHRLPRLIQFFFSYLMYDTRTSNETILFLFTASVDISRCSQA